MTATQNTEPASRPTLLLVLLTLLGFAVGLWLAWQGLTARLFGVLPFPLGRTELWAAWAHAAGLPASAFGWPLVILGTSWWGATLGLWLRNKWGWPAALILAALSLLHVWEVSLLAGLILAMLLVPAVRRWGLGR